MIQVTPNYYNKFKCIADKCKHNCCIGWEIDIDERTMEFYSSLASPLGERIRNSVEGEAPHFRLKEGDRCPFLNDSNLCDIISELGEEGLCDICHLHPRFRNFYNGFCEIGLGLCCEEAARIILSEKEKFVIELPKSVELTEQETEFFETRNLVFSILQDRSISIRERFCRLSEIFSFEYDFSIPLLCDELLSLERLDEKWTEELKSLKVYGFDKSIFNNEYYSVYLENLAVYFVYRHMANAEFVVEYPDYIKFSLLSTYVIAAIWAKNNCRTLEELSEVARMYSSEIEYSEDNTWALLDL